MNIKQIKFADLPPLCPKFMQEEWAMGPVAESIKQYGFSCTLICEGSSITE